MPKNRPHICKSVDKKGLRKCGICGCILNNKNYERYKKICGKCNRKIQREKERKFRLELLELFGKKCKICEYDKFIECLEFHHLDPFMKEGKHFENDVKKHPEKSELLCNRCHRETEIILAQKQGRKFGQR